MAQPPTYPAHRPTIPHSNTPTDRSIPTNYQAAPRLSFYPSTLNGPENRVDTHRSVWTPFSLSLFLFPILFFSLSPSPSFSPSFSHPLPLPLSLSRSSDRPSCSTLRGTRSRETLVNGNRDRSVHSLYPQTIRTLARTILYRCSINAAKNLVSTSSSRIRRPGLRAAPCTSAAGPSLPRRNGWLNFQPNILRASIPLRYRGKLRRDRSRIDEFVSRVGGSGSRISRSKRRLCFGG